MGRVADVQDAPASWTTGPVELPPNQPPDRPYRGGTGIDRFRGLPVTADDHPEDLVGSTTELNAGGGLGLTVLPDGVPLREHVAADPEGFLGTDHVARFGADPALLVKLLDTAERLFVHFHPNDEFAAAHLNCRYGKTEAWYILATRTEQAEVYLGFRDDISAEQVRSWVDGQDAPAMLAAMNRVPVKVGDSILVPGGLPHAIGPGITLLELQEPTDFSLLLEWAGYGVTRADADLGLGLDLALEALDRSAWDEARVAGLRGDTEAGAGVTPVFPPAADPFFRGELVTVDGTRTVEAGFSILVGLDGELTVGGRGGLLDLRRGRTALLPHGAGPAELTGGGRLLRARPPRATNSR
jgi:mannose-6-phosphate isomerase